MTCSVITEPELPPLLSQFPPHTQTVILWEKLPSAELLSAGRMKLILTGYNQPVGVQLVALASGRLHRICEKIMDVLQTLSVSSKFSFSSHTHSCEVLFLSCWALMLVTLHPPISQNIQTTDR